MSVGQENNSACLLCRKIFSKLEIHSLPALARRLNGLLTTNKLNDAIIVGHSLGGMIVQEYLAARIPGAQFVSLPDLGHLTHLFPRCRHKSWSKHDKRHLASMPNATYCPAEAGL